MISLETLKLYQMYLERKKQHFKNDTTKTWSENLSEYIMIDLILDKIKNGITYHEEVLQ